MRPIEPRSTRPSVSRRWLDAERPLPCFTSIPLPFPSHPICGVPAAGRFLVVRPCPCISPPGVWRAGGFGIGAAAKGNKDKGLCRAGLSAKAWRAVADWRVRQPATEKETALIPAETALASTAAIAYEAPQTAALRLASVGRGSA